MLELAEYGDPEGVPVVFQHGTPGTCRAGAIVAEAASRLGVRLLAVSRPGYGGSPVTPPGLASVAGQVADLADELGIGGSASGDSPAAVRARSPRRR